MAIALVANAVAGGINGATTGGINTTGADLLVIAVGHYAGTPTVSDSNGNTWTPLTQYGASGNRSRIHWCVPVTVGAGHTFTVTGAGLVPAIAVLAFSGAYATPYDTENGATSNQTGSVTPSEDNEVLVSTLCFYPSGTLSIDSSFTISDQLDYNASVSMGIGMAYQIQTTATARNPTWSTTTSFSESSSAIATFKAAAGGGGPSGSPWNYYAQQCRRLNDAFRLRSMMATAQLLGGA